MICDDAAEYVSALCDGETIPPTAAQHIGSCPDCQGRLRDYLAMAVELRQAASLGMADAVPSRTWTRPQNRAAAWWQEGWGTMRIPRFAFAALIVGILALASALAVDKVRARDTGSVVLLHTTGPGGLNLDCPISTQEQDKIQSQYGCVFYATVGRQTLGYKVNLLSRNGGRIQLAVRTRTYPVTPGTRSFGAFELDGELAREVWFEPGEPLQFDVPEVGTLTLKGVWLDHVPVLVHGQDLSPGPSEFRFSSPLLLKDKKVAVDLVGSIGGLFSTDDRNFAVQVYIPSEGRFLLSLVPLKGALEAHVNFSRISFEEGGHSWEFVTGTPVSRAREIWVLHQPDFKLVEGFNPDSASVGNQALKEVGPGVWFPADMAH